MNEHYPFQLMPLPYGYDALEPYIDTQTMMLHHDKHLQAYIDNLNHALAPYPAYRSWSLERLITQTNLLPKAIQTPIRNNGGGVYNHQLFFSAMGPNGPKVPGETLQKAIEESFGSMEQWKVRWKSSGLSVFGSGWTWLAVNSRRQLVIVNTPNQDTVLTIGLCPILLMDVWEHAYYLNYQNRRGDYIENWLNTVDWDKVQARYDRCMARIRR